MGTATVHRLRAGAHAQPASHPSPFLCSPQPLGSAEECRSCQPPRHSCLPAHLPDRIVEGDHEKHEQQDDHEGEHHVEQGTGVVGGRHVSGQLHRPAGDVHPAAGAAAA